MGLQCIEIVVGEADIKAVGIVSDKYSLAPGEMAELVATYKNFGTMPGSAVCEIKEDGIVICGETISLNSGEQKDLVCSFTPIVAKTYHICAYPDSV